MNLIRRDTPSRSICFPTIGYLFCLLCLLTAGCGSKSEEQKVVPPPEPAEKVDPDSSTTDPPGTLELPPGEIPADGSAEPEQPGGLELPDGPIETTTSDASDSVQVQYASWKEIEQRASTPGQITVVDVWSTVCAPCIKEFPGLVKLHREQGQNIQCLSVDVDYDGRKSRPPQHYEPAVVGFLKNVGASFPNYICNTPSEDVYAALDIVSIPAVLIYDANGKLIKRFIDADETAGFTYEKDIVPFLDTLAGN